MAAARLTGIALVVACLRLSGEVIHRTAQLRASAKGKQLHTTFKGDDKFVWRL